VSQNNKSKLFKRNPAYFIHIVMPRPGVASPAYNNGWRSRIFANAASGMTFF